MLSVVLAALLIGQTPSSEERPPHPLAPSLPTPTKAENAAYKKTIDRLIDIEINKGSPAAVREATRAVDELPPEAVFVLVDRFNYAASNEHSCPAVILAKKITNIIQRSGDAHLVSYVKENAGAGMAAKRHLGVLKDLQIACVVRRNQIQAAGIALQTGLNRPPASMTLAELSAAVTKIPPSKVPVFLAEAEKRKDPLKLDVLAIAAERKEKDVQNLARGMLKKQLNDANDSDLRACCKHKRVEVRKGRARFRRITRRLVGRSDHRPHARRRPDGSPSRLRHPCPLQPRHGHRAMGRLQPRTSRASRGEMAEWLKDR
ncbi:MAG: hypothetical protein U0744_21235 [Gemmataceae bacterium]